MAALAVIPSETGRYRDNKYKIDKDLLIKLREVSRGGLLNEVIEQIDELQADENGFYLIDCPVFYDIMSMFSEKTGINVRHQPVIPEDATELQIKWYKEIENAAKEVCTFGEFDKDSLSTVRLVDDFEIVKEFIDDPNRLLKFIDAATKLNDLEANYHLLKDLVNASKDVKKNLSYFMDEIIADRYEKEFIELINQNDMEGAKNYLEKVQNLILEHYNDFTSSLDNYQFGDEFRYICHSVKSLDISGDWLTRFISTSLLTNDLNETFNTSCGFVFAPKNIVGANSHDMYANNIAKSEDDLLFYSSIRKIDSPERLIEECTELINTREESEEPNKKVYNEVVIDGFEPIAIFCVTDGTKELCREYRGAKKLQEQFPHLKIVELDGTRRLKTEEDIKKHKVWTVAKLCAVMQRNDHFPMDAFFNHSADYHISYNWLGIGRGCKHNDDEILFMFSPFLDEYEKIKKGSNLTYDAILKAFKSNYDLIETREVFENGFLDNCSPREFEICVKYNRYSYVNELFKGTYINDELKTLYAQFGKYVNDNRLDCISGLSELLFLYNKAENLGALRYSHFYSAKSIPELNALLKNTIEQEEKRIEEIEKQKQVEELEKQAKIDDLTRRKDKLVMDRDFFQSRLLELVNLESAKEQEIDTFNINREIVNEEFWYSLAKGSIESSQEEISKLEQSQKENKIEIEHLQEQLMQIEQKLHDLSRHKFLFRYKISRLLLNKKIISIDLDSLNRYLQSDQECINEIITNIASEEKEFLDETGIKISEYEQILQSAKLAISGKSLDELFDEKWEINRQIGDLQSEISSIEYDIRCIEDRISIIKGEYTPMPLPKDPLEDTLDFGIGINVEEDQQSYENAGESR